MVDAITFLQPIYATLSDIVLYSSYGVTRTVLDLADRIKSAVESKAIERHGGPLSSSSSSSSHGDEEEVEPVRYNVFVITDPFSAFERNHPELVAADSRGRAVQHTDFMAREKEEMRELTQATVIEKGVWVRLFSLGFSSNVLLKSAICDWQLGNTADVPMVPLPSLMAPDVDPFDTSTNAIIVTDPRTGATTGGWDICIECRDDAYFPTPAHLRHAEDHIAKLEQVWAQTQQAKREREIRERERERECFTPLGRASSGSPRMANTTTTAGTPSSGSGSGSGSRMTGTDSPPIGAGSGANTPPTPLSPTLMGLSNLRVNTASPTPMPFRTARERDRDREFDTNMRSRSASPSPAGVDGANGRRPIVTRQRSNTTSRHQSPTPQSQLSQQYHQHQQAQQQLPPRPPPNPRSIVHLSFPSSPPSNPHTTTQLLNMLAFLARYADPAGYTSYAGSGGLSGANNGGLSASKRRGSLSSAFTSSNGSGGASIYTYTPQPVNHSPPNPNAPPARPLRILLHSMDGYTETSVLALSYLMHARRCSLPEAYLELQIERARSFFVCPGDMGVLRRVEATLASLASQAADGERKREEKVALRKEREREKEKERTMMMLNAAGAPNPNSSLNGHHSHLNGGHQVVASNAPQQDSSSRWGKWSGSWRSGSLGLGAAFGSFSASTNNSEQQQQPSTPGVSSSVPNESVPAHMHPEVSRTGGAGSSSAPIPSPSSSPGLGLAGLQGQMQPPTPPQVRATRARALTSPVSLPSHVDHSAWFMDPRFDGSFPSRVLPFLYLGNL